MIQNFSNLKTFETMNKEVIKTIINVIITILTALTTTLTTTSCLGSF